MWRPWRPRFGEIVHFLAGVLALRVAVGIARNLQRASFMSGRSSAMNLPFNDVNEGADGLNDLMGGAASSSASRNERIASGWTDQAFCDRRTMGD